MSAALLIGGIVGYFMYNKPHRDIVGSNAEFRLTASDLASEFENDEVASNAKYLDQVVEVTGVLVASSTNPDGTITLILEDEFEGVSATVDPEFLAENNALVSGCSIGETITVKGKCDGMIMLQGVMLNKCTLHK